MLLKDILKGLNDVITCLWIRRLTTVKLSIIPIVDYIFIATPVQVSTGFKMYFIFFIFWNLSCRLKNVHRVKRSKDPLEGKNKLESICPTMSSIYNKSAVIRMMWY